MRGTLDQVKGRLAVAAIVISVVVTGCSHAPEPAVRPTTAPTGRTPSPAHTAGLFVVESRTLGPIVIDGQGYVLYRFDADSPNPSQSNCVNACAAAWLPVPAVADPRVVGIDRQLVGQTIRPDGSAQLTLAGWPLYTYTNDRMPGDATGHRHDNQWFVIAPNGARAAAPAAPAG